MVHSRSLPEPVAATAYNVYNGVAADDAAGAVLPTAARLGLEPPRFCGACGRRMIVQVRPDGWSAKCSRHGQVDSKELDPRR